MYILVLMKMKINKINQIKKSKIKKKKNMNKK